MAPGVCGGCVWGCVWWESWHAWGIAVVLPSMLNGVKRLNYFPSLFPGLWPSECLAGAPRGALSPRTRAQMACHPLGIAGLAPWCGGFCLGRGRPGWSRER